MLREPLAMDGIEPLRTALASAQRFLYLGDNCGETVFDRLLIETIGQPITYAVRGGPVINDATRADAEQAGLFNGSEVIDNGDDAPGTILSRCLASFRERFAAADLILAKGQGNYESLSAVDAPVFFLLQAKCPVIANDLGVRVRALIVKPPKAA